MTPPQRLGDTFGGVLAAWETTTGQRVAPAALCAAPHPLLPGIRCLLEPHGPDRMHESTPDHGWTDLEPMENRMSDETHPQTGDVYATPDGDRIVVHRVARNRKWADITVTQAGGASWRKRQPLRDGELPFASVRIFEIPTGGAA